ncbi:hypothetical protein SAMN05421774_10868 [Gemmobacter megaterium]|uniref:Phage P22-like portal protein n=1 Tax=Gemmobacter megaterium TaxID=1086013 RepID=A0A1N7QBW8_9RHOB|nr:hypothetical protein [Gemmobacter megaterium]GGE24211.1 hypothetical protein GCM10011345_32760 [Gemmobacter megaterium]SIT20047.1 hypothetical protein SAMN05421774_10868 [Gemmobacter megaterium]
MFDPQDTNPRNMVEYDPRRPAQAGDGYFERMQAQHSADKASSKIEWMDGPQGQAMHVRVLGHYTRELERQNENRLQMAMDEAMYDHQQWTDEELAALAARGQAPIVFNMIQTSVNWVLGSQRRAPMDYKVLPRHRDGLKQAEIKSQLLAHLRDVNRSEFAYAQAFTDAVKAGVGWVETGQGDPEDGTIVFDRWESWRSMLWDSTSTRMDIADARYVMRAKWLDLDLATALWPERKGVLLSAADDVTPGLLTLDDLGDEAMDAQELAHFDTSGPVNRHYDTERRRVRCIEVWFKRVQPNAKIIRGGQFNGELLDEWSPGHWQELATGRATLVTRPREVVHCALLTDAGFLDIRESPYRHNRYPFTPIWGYRRASDGMPYGLIRGLRDIQRDLNKRASKALHHLSTTRVTVEEGAVDDIEELRDEAGRPDAVIVHKPNRTPPKIETDTNLAAAHIDLMSRDAQMIQQVSGVTDENLGRKTNAASGKAIIARQEQGQLATFIFFENLRQARMIHGEKLLVNVEQFYTEADEFRITDSRGNPQYISINNGDPNTAIANSKADFVITEDDWRATARQAQAEELLGLMERLAATAPQIVLQTLDLVVEALDVPKRDELVKRIRQITGAEDPDADPNNPTPEKQAADAAKAEADAMQKRAAEAELAEKEAKAAKTRAEAEKAAASLPADQIAKLKAAFEAAVAIAGAPAVARAADQILANAEASGAPPAAAPAAATIPPGAVQPTEQPTAQPAAQGAIQ